MRDRSIAQRVFFRFTAISPLIAGSLCLFLSYLYCPHSIVPDADQCLNNALSFLAAGIAQIAVSLIILLAAREGLPLDCLNLPRGFMLILGSLSLTFAGVWHTTEVYLGGTLAFLAVTYFWSADATSAVSC
jgi:hypothetical protein